VEPLEKGTKLTGWIEAKIEKWLGLEINRYKTRVVGLRENRVESPFVEYWFWLNPTPT
jgi:hypothetical protein